MISSTEKEVSMFSKKRNLSLFLSTLMVLMLNTSLASAGTGADSTLSSGKALTGAADSKLNAQPPAAVRGNCRPPTRFDARNFGDPTNVNNGFTPLVPGTKVVLRGYSNVGGTPLPHTIEFIVTDLTKVIDGVPSVVSWDRDFQDNQLTESELVFNAQDDAGYVWNLGEYPEEYENGQLIGAPSTWISGIDRAKPGTLMLPQPQVGGAAYLQGSSPTISFLDCAQVVQTNQHVCAQGNCYDNVLVTDETSPLAPDSGVQRKFYAPGLGAFQVTAVGDPEGETLVLESLVHLSRGALAQVHRQALELDQRGYQISAVYQHTPPAR
jgi:hypothetical protein